MGNESRLKLEERLEAAGFDVEEESFPRFGSSGEDSPEDSAVVGVDVCGPVSRLVYDYDKLVEAVAGGFSRSGNESDVDLLEQAAEFVDYNHARSLPYMGEGAPVIMRRLPTWKEVEDARSEPVEEV